MVNEVKFGNYVETGEYVTEIDLGELIRRELLPTVHLCSRMDKFVQTIDIYIQWRTRTGMGDAKHPRLLSPPPKL